MHQPAPSAPQDAWNDYLCQVCARTLRALMHSDDREIVAHVNRWLSVRLEHDAARRYTAE